MDVCKQAVEKYQIPYGKARNPHSNTFHLCHHHHHNHNPVQLEDLQEDPVGGAKPHGDSTSPSPGTHATGVQDAGDHKHQQQLQLHKSASFSNIPDVEHHTGSSTIAVQEEKGSFLAKLTLALASSASPTRQPSSTMATVEPLRSTASITATKLPPIPPRAPPPKPGNPKDPVKFKVGDLSSRLWLMVQQMDDEVYFV